MSVRFTANELSSVCNGVWTHLPARPFFDGIYTDSRVDCPGGVFVALKGDRFDGHDFLERAASNGAGALIAEHAGAAPLLRTGLPLLLVDDTLRAYQALARHHRRRFPNLVCAAITGSVGKTSAKEMLRAIFKCRFGAKAVLATEGNTNNQIGVPQNIFRLDESIKAAVFEMGTSSFGEIEPLSRMAEPTVALVNAIAPCHLEKLENLEGVAVEKAKIFDHAARAAVIPFDCAQRGILESEADRHKLRKFFFGGGRDCGIWSEYRSGTLTGSVFTLHLPSGAYEVSWKLSGRHQARNAAAAAAAAVALEIPDEIIVSGLQGTELPGMRMRVTVCDGVTYANDAYNANPESVKACLQHFSEFANPKKLVLVLGDMLELGASEAQEHQSALAFARDLFPATRLVAVGPRMAAAAAALELGGPSVLAADAEAAKSVMKRLVRHGDTVLLKASRGIHLENALAPEAR